MKLNRLKLDIEDKLWSFLETESIIKTIQPIIKLVMDSDRSKRVKDGRTKVDDESNPVLKACNQVVLDTIPNLQVQIFEGVNAQSNTLLGSVYSANQFYIYYHPFFSKHFNDDEIYSLIAHEFGHYVYMTPYSPEELIRAAKIFYGDNSPSLVRFNILANMLSHLSEYNADRYALSLTKNTLLFCKTAKKAYEYCQKLIPNPASEQQIEEIKKGPWQYTFIVTHPFLDDREKALKLIERKIHNETFNINMDDEIREKLLELIHYKKFIEEYGEFYSRSIA